MDVRLVGVPMVDRHPIELSPEIALGMSHQVAGVGAKVGELGRVLGADDEPEVVAVLFAAICERRDVGRVAACIEHAGVGAVARHALPLEIAQVLGERG